MLRAASKPSRPKAPSGLLARWRAFRGEREGAILVELAFIMPILVAILIGGVEVGRYLMIHQKLSRLADSTSDLVAQKKTLNTDDLDDIFESAAYMLDPIELGPDGVVFISSVTAPPGESPLVDWQVSGAGDGSASSTLGDPGDPATLPSGFALDDGENIIIAEVFYDYSPAILEQFTSPRTIYYRVLDRPRFGALSQLDD